MKDFTQNLSVVRVVSFILGTLAEPMKPSIYNCNSPCIIGSRSVGNKATTQQKTLFYFDNPSKDDG